MNDYFAFVYNKHKDLLEKVLLKSKNNKNVKTNGRDIWEKDGEYREKLNFYEEPTKTHLLFKKLEEGKDSSWKSVLFNFYNEKMNDLNRFIKDRKNQFSFLSQIDNLGITKRFSFKLTLTSPLYTASENKFYSIGNAFAKEKPTGIPIFKGSSLKGALRQAAVEVVEEELLNANYGNKFKELSNKTEDEILNKESNDRFYFEKRAQLVRLFGNEKDAKWFTFRSLIATDGIKDASKTKEVLEKISKAFEKYLKTKRIIKDENSCRGRLIFSDLYFDKVSLDVITPLDRNKRTPVHGPLYYEVIPEGTETTGTIIWFPFDLIAMGKSESEINAEWENDKEIIEKAFDKLKETGIGAKTKDGWGRFSWEEI